MRLRRGWWLAAALLACSQQEAEDPAQARMKTEVASVREAMKAQPNSPDLYYQLGLVFQRYGLTDSARTALQKSVDLYPEAPQSQRDLAQMDFDAGDLAASAQAWAKVAQLVPEDLEAWNNLGFVRRQLGDLDGAEAAYRTALDIDSTYAQTLNNLAQVYREQGRDELAVAHFHKALVADPTFRGAYTNLANLYHEMGNTQAERRLLEEIRERFGRTSREGRYATERLMELGPADG